MASKASKQLEKWHKISHQVHNGYNVINEIELNWIEAEHYIYFSSFWCYYLLLLLLLVVVIDVDVSCVVIMRDKWQDDRKRNNGKTSCQMAEERVKRNGIKTNVKQTNRQREWNRDNSNNNKRTRVHTLYGYEFKWTLKII